MLTKLRIGCSKLKTHRFLGKNENLMCPLCKSDSDSTDHILLRCPQDDIKCKRKMFLDDLAKIYPNFKYLNEVSKICSILNLTPFDSNVNNKKYSDNCLKYMCNIVKLRFEKEK